MLIAALLLAAAASPDAAAQEVRPPAQVRGFVMSDSSRYEQAELGITYTYRNEAERVGANVYVYPVEPERRALPEAQQIAREAEGFVAGLPAGVERGWYSAYELVVNEARTFETAGGPRPGHLVAVVLRRPEGVAVSFMHLVLVGDHYVKTRLTLPAEQWRTSTAPEFGLDLFRQLPAPAPAGP